LKDENTKSRITSDEFFAIIPESILYSDISDKALRLYCVLRRYADKGSGESHPSRRTLAEKTKCSVDTVDRAIRELQDIGALVVEHRFIDSEDGLKKENTSNNYIVKSSIAVAATVPIGGRTHAARGGRNDAARVAAPTRPKQEPLKQESFKTKEKHLATEIVADNSFQNFWEMYPKKVGRTGKGGAEGAFVSACNRANGVEKIMKGLLAWRTFWSDTKIERQFIPNPATWLNQSRWEEEVPLLTSDNETTSHMSAFDRTRAAIDRVSRGMEETE